MFNWPLSYKIFFLKRKLIEWNIQVVLKIEGFWDLVESIRWLYKRTLEEINSFIAYTKLLLHMSRRPYRWKNTKKRMIIRYMVFVSIRESYKRYIRNRRNFGLWIVKGIRIKYITDSFYINHIIMAFYFYKLLNYLNILVILDVYKNYISNHSVHYMYRYTYIHVNTSVVISVILTLLFINIFRQKKIINMFINSIFLLTSLLIVCQLSGAEQLGYFMFLSELLTFLIIFVISQNKKNNNNSTYNWVYIIYLVLIPLINLKINGTYNYINFYDTIYQNTYSDFVNLSINLYVLGHYIVYICYVLYIFSIVCIINFAFKDKESFVNSIGTSNKTISLSSFSIFKQNFYNNTNIFIKKWR